MRKLMLLKSLFVGAFASSIIVVSTTGCGAHTFLQDYTNHPEQAGFDPIKLAELSNFLEGKMNEWQPDGQSPKCYGFPSMQLCITKDKKIVYNRAFGQALKYDQGNPNDANWDELKTDNKYGKLLPENQQIQATNSTLYDLASNTKMYASMLAIQNLMYRKIITSLDDPISKYIPSFQKTQTDVPYGDSTTDKRTVPWSTITIRQILSHQAGFVPTPEDLIQTYSGHPLRDRNKLLEYVINYLNLQYVPGTNQEYSDVDFMLASALIKQVSGLYIDQYCQKYIYNTFNLKHTTYTPLKYGFKKEQCAATELRGNSREFKVGKNIHSDIRTTTIQGEVHDEASYYCMQGVSGHAGLFSTASDLSILMNLMLYKGQLGNVKLFNEKIYEDVTTPTKNPVDNHYEYDTGWKNNLPTGSDAWNSYLFGLNAPKQVFGHDGWTGTFTLIDPINNMTMCILTNSIHTTLFDHDTDQNNFWGKQHYFTYEGQNMFSGTRIGRVVFDKIYDCCDTYVKG